MTPMIYGAEKTKPHISSGTMLARRRNAAAKKQILHTTFFLLAKHPTKLRIKTCVIFSHFSTLIVGTLINRRIYMKVLELQLQNNDFLKIYKKMLHQISCLLIQQSLKCKTQPVISRQETNELMLIFCLDIWPNYCIVQLYHKVLIESDSIGN